jgi:hypothetical protein
MGKNRQKESANSIFTDTTSIGTDLMLDTIIGLSLMHMQEAILSLNILLQETLLHLCKHT